MATLLIAARANYALLLPSLALAYWVNSRELEPVIDVRFKDVDTLPQGKTVSFTGGYGDVAFNDAVIAAIVQAFSPIQLDRQDQVLLPDLPEYARFAVLTDH